MIEARRTFLKTAALTTAAVGIATAATPRFEATNGVVMGKSSKKEILYTKTRAWEDFYKSAR
ncbi:MAG: twin-arginine translocation signal domain-containing protein [Campylobacterales bacterium]|nr:twin-arginine translocation signal domain-containing protein [Campylobacterales bacterium]